MTQDWKKELKEDIYQVGLMGMKYMKDDSLKEDCVFVQKRLLLRVENLLKEERNAVLSEVEKEVGKLYEPYEGEEQIMIEHHILDEVSTIINNLRVK